jgi:phosphoribosylformylglycinamidine cyclo-ligase
MRGRVQRAGVRAHWGETTEQPDILPAGTYIFGSNIVGVVDRSRIIDGSRITKGDVVVALASSGPHTNGFTLVHDLLRQDLSLAQKQVGTGIFIDAVLAPHRCY